MAANTNSSPPSPEAFSARANRLVDAAGAYLFEELTHGGQFVISARARNLFRDFNAHLEQKHFVEKHKESIEEVSHDPNAAFSLER